MSVCDMCGTDDRSTLPGPGVAVAPPHGARTVDPQPLRTLRPPLQPRRAPRPHARPQGGRMTDLFSITEVAHQLGIGVEAVRDHDAHSDLPGFRKVTEAFAPLKYDPIDRITRRTVPLRTITEVADELGVTV